MPFILHHAFVSERLIPTRQTSGAETFFKVNKEGEFVALYPGLVRRIASATFLRKFNVGDIDNPTGGPGTQQRHGGIATVTEIIPLQLTIFTPDGREFTGTEITLADLRKFRDLRGMPVGNWSYKVTGESRRFVLEPDSDEPDVDLAIINPEGRVGIGVQETVRSESAPPLVANVLITPTRQSFTFDLFREGTFVAQISALPGVWRGSMRLLDPDGTAVARTTGRTLRFPVGVATLGKSRDAAGRVRKWTLEVSPQGGVIAGEVRISATVIGSARINTEVLKNRLDKLIGPSGSFINLFGENKGGQALARLEITDKFAAETIDLYGLLETPLSWAEQDPGVEPDPVQEDTIYTLGRRSESLPFNTKLDVKTLKVGKIELSIGPGVRLAASIPTVRLTVEVSGKLKVKAGPLTLIEAEVRDGVLEMEVGITVSADGTPRLEIWVPDSPFDVDIDEGVAIALGLITGPIVTGTGIAVFEELVEERIINEGIVSGAHEFFSDPTLAPRNLMMILGAHVTHLPPRLEGGDIVFDYIAPLEPDPAPRPGYSGVIGRSIVDTGVGTTRFQPPLLPDTWAADNLTEKIQHIVVVMMENRSYDHVLGYRARGEAGDGADGLTDDLITAIEIKKAPKVRYNVRELRDAEFKTRLPKNVGHSLEDVAEQLSERVPGPDDRLINSPKGFVDNFKPKITPEDDPDPQGVREDDVLGYYVAEDLPFFAYLAKHYAYCDRYYCSHPGPTLPNRMYSLTGDVQYDRFGVPILNNNHGDNFLLSRAVTIYDWLTRQGIGWRVYESDPSVTMLRMFARYATDDINIVSIGRLRADVKAGNLPAFTAIEPAMHHPPQNDDHPPADMHRGQLFLQDVYNALRSNREVWEKTLLIITYDEHGGLYDHVIPPIADLLEAPGGLVATAKANAPLPPPAQAATTQRVPYGVRVPTFVVSPWVAPGKGPSLTLDHCSIPKTVLARFGGGNKPFISDRVHASQSFNAFLTEDAPREVPDPQPLKQLKRTAKRLAKGASAIDTRPLSRKQMREGSVDFHDLTGWWARQLGR